VKILLMSYTFAALISLYLLRFLKEAFVQKRCAIQNLSTF
jgi:hypothetical protein